MRFGCVRIHTSSTSATTPDKRSQTQSIRKRPEEHLGAFLLCRSMMKGALDALCHSRPIGIGVKASSDMILIRNNHSTLHPVIRLPVNSETSLKTRGEAALTHPATLIALAVLLFNDLVLKSVWQGSWITGKLSDLAWVVFASPLLAFLLMFFAGDKAKAQLAAWDVAYIGLPLLYAAYNTFEPLHDLISRGMSLLSGKAGGSPFDPTDSE